MCLCDYVFIEICLRFLSPSHSFFFFFYFRHLLFSLTACLCVSVSLGFIASVFLKLSVTFLFVLSSVISVSDFFWSLFLSMYESPPRYLELVSWAEFYSHHQEKYFTSIVFNKTKEHGQKQMSVPSAPFHVSSILCLCDFLCFL